MNGLNQRRNLDRVIERHGENVECQVWRYSESRKSTLWFYGAEPRLVMFDLDAVRWQMLILTTSCLLVVDAERKLTSF